MLDKGDPISFTTTVNNVSIHIRIIPGFLITIHEWSNNNGNYTLTYRDYFHNGEITIYKGQTTEIIKQESNLSPEESQPTNGTIMGSYEGFSVDSIYYPNGTITIRENIFDSIIQHGNEHFEYKYYARENDITNFYISENITKYTGQILPYEEALEQNPTQTVDDTAELFININKQYFESVDKQYLQEESILFFTSDYGLYWWDYKSGYDMILAELGWNHTTTQDIALIRGASNIQNKLWGTIITWKYTHPPYLTDGKEMFEQMKIAYEVGAEYVLIFNYSEDIENPNTLQDEHFLALERFWKDVVQNPKIKYNSIKAEAALVLPQNYGWGMRHPEDNIWGIWPADDRSQQIWSQLQSKIEQYGLKLDIVFEDPDYPIEGKYSKIYYWDQK